MTQNNSHDRTRLLVAIHRLDTRDDGEANYPMSESYYEDLELVLKAARRELVRQSTKAYAESATPDY